MHTYLYKIENGNKECAKETRTRPIGKLQSKATNRSSIQRETPATGGVLQLTPQQNYATNVVQ